MNRSQLSRWRLWRISSPLSGQRLQAIAILLHYSIQHPHDAWTWYFQLSLCMVLWCFRYVCDVAAPIMIAQRSGRAFSGWKKQFCDVFVGVFGQSCNESLGFRKTHSLTNEQFNAIVAQRCFYCHKERRKGRAYSSTFCRIFCSYSDHWLSDCPLPDLTILSCLVTGSGYTTSWNLYMQYDHHWWCYMWLCDLNNQNLNSKSTHTHHNSLHQLRVYDMDEIIGPLISVAKSCKNP